MSKPLYYRTPYTDDETIPPVPEDCTVVHLPTVTTPEGGQKATCHCDFDMIDPQCVVKKDVP